MTRLSTVSTVLLAALLLGTMIGCAAEVGEPYIVRNRPGYNSTGYEGSSP